MSQNETPAMTSGQLAKKMMELEKQLEMYKKEYSQAKSREFDIAVKKFLDDFDIHTVKDLNQVASILRRSKPAAKDRSAETPPQRKVVPTPHNAVREPAAQTTQNAVKTVEPAPVNTSEKEEVFKEVKVETSINEEPAHDADIQEPDTFDKESEDSAEEVTSPDAAADESDEEVTDDKADPIESPSISEDKDSSNDEKDEDDEDDSSEDMDFMGMFGDDLFSDFDDDSKKE